MAKKYYLDGRVFKPGPGRNTSFIGQANPKNLNDIILEVVGTTLPIVPATTTVQGIIELATNAEAIAKASTTVVLTPSNLAALGASTTFAGLTEFSTDAEALAKVSTTTALTPSNLAALGSTTTFAGLSELATDAEALAKVSTTTVLTPSNLAALDATTTFKGLSELATDAEAIAGVSTTTVVTPASLAAAIAAIPATGAVNIANFYALMPGDNAATVAVGGFLDFPQDGVNVGTAITRDGVLDDSFAIVASGVYKIYFQASVDEAGQLAVAVNGVEDPNTVTGRATGTNYITGEFLLDLTAGDTIQIINPIGNAAALTITPIAGGANTVSAHLIIEQVSAAGGPGAQTLAQVLAIGDISGGSDINMSDGDVIKAVSGGGRLDLRYAGVNNSVALTTDGGNFLEGWFYADSTFAQMGFTVQDYFNASTNSVYMQSASGASFMGANRMGMYDTAGIFPNCNINLVQLGGAPVTSYSQVEVATFINTGTNASPSTYNNGISRSVILGGLDIIAKTSNTAYCNQLGINNPGSALETIVSSETLTSNRTVSFPDASGSVSLIRYVAITTPTVHTAANGEIVDVTTGAGALVVNLPSAAIPGQQITIKKTDAGAGQATVTPNGADTIDGQANFPLLIQTNSVTLVSNGASDWLVIAII